MGTESVRAEKRKFAEGPGSGVYLAGGVCVWGCAGGRGRNRGEDTTNDPCYTRREDLTVHVICCYLAIVSG